MEKHFGRSEDGCLVGGSRRELGEDPSLDSSPHPTWGMFSPTTPYFIAGEGWGRC